MKLQWFYLQERKCHYRQILCGTAIDSRHRPAQWQLASFNPEYLPLSIAFFSRSTFCPNTPSWTDIRCQNAGMSSSRTKNTSSGKFCARHKSWSRLFERRMPHFSRSCNDASASRPDFCMAIFSLFSLSMYSSTNVVMICKTYLPSRFITFLYPPNPLFRNLATLTIVAVLTLVSFAILR